MSNFPAINVALYLMVICIGLFNLTLVGLPYKLFSTLCFRISTLNMKNSLETVCFLRSVNSKGKHNKQIMILWIKKVTWTSTIYILHHHLTKHMMCLTTRCVNTMFNSTILHEQCTIRLTNIEIFLVLLFFILFQIQMSWDFVRKHHDRSFLLKRTTNLSE